MLHAWNVKRLRPHQMVPYDYSRPQATELLWVSEGITDYYADLALVRGGIVPPQVFYQLTSGKIGDVGSTPPVALEDASLSTWIGPTDGTEYIYYDKGSLAGFIGGDAAGTYTIQVSDNAAADLGTFESW